MKKIISAVLAAACLTACTHAFAADKITVHGQETKTINNSIVKNNSTMVPIREIAEALDLNIIWFADTRSLVLWSDGFEFRAAVDKKEAKINGEDITLTESPCLKNGLTYLPLRNVSEVVNAKVVWDGETGSIDIYKNTPSEKANITLSADKKIFYSQKQDMWGFENGGSGYCWVCAYAMALSEALGEVVTPDEVAAVNKESGTSGAFMQHAKITENFDVSFVSVLSESSDYFKSYEPWKGATYLNVSSNEEAVAALKEALDENPQGVMVRYTVYPHTLYAVGYSGDEILFNEPAYENGDYVTFDETCLKKYNLYDFDFIQAIKKN